MLFLITILIVSRIWHSSNYTFVHCWSRPHTLPLSPWCQLLPSEPRVYWVYLLRLWPNHIYPTVFTRSTHCDAAVSLSLFQSLLSVLWPLLCSPPPTLTSGDRQCTMWLICNCERAVMATICGIQGRKGKRNSSEPMNMEKISSEWSLAMKDWSRVHMDGWMDETSLQERCHFFWMYINWNPNRGFRLDRDTWRKRYSNR